MATPTKADLAQEVANFTQSMDRLIRAARSDNSYFEDHIRGFEAVFDDKNQALDLDKVEKTLQDFNSVESARRALFDGAMADTGDTVKNLAAIKIAASRALEQALPVAADQKASAIVKSSFASARRSVDRIKEIVVGAAVDLKSFMRSPPAGDAPVSIGAPVPGAKFPIPGAVQAANLKDIDFSFLAEQFEAPAPATLRPTMS